MCPPCPRPSPSSRAGEGLAALLFLLGLPRGLFPLPGHAGVSRCRGGAALRTDGGTSQLSPNGVLCALKPRPAQGVVLCELAGWPPADLSAFLFSERDRSRVYLLCCRLAPARKGTAVVWEARPGELFRRERGKSHRPPSPLRSWALTPRK